MKEAYILLSQDGPHNNVIKFKPPMCFNKDNVDHVISKLDTILTDVETGAACLKSSQKPAHAIDLAFGKQTNGHGENGNDEPLEKRARIIGGGIDTSIIDQDLNGQAVPFSQSTKVH